MAGTQFRGQFESRMKSLIGEIKACGNIILVIDEVHNLSGAAFNAMLKTLEEPPSYVIFILATTESHKIPITISSRCQRYDFKRITIDTISDRLHELMETEKVEVEEKALRYVAKTDLSILRLPQQR